MSNSEKCPECGSDAIISIAEHNQNFCKDCHHGWEMNAPQPTPTINVSLSKANHPQVKAFCRNLANSSPWVDKVATHWPAPIAHEYHRLREILADEQLIVSAMWQLKDVAEVLLKFPAIVMAQWVFTQQRHTTLFNTVQQDLLSQLSMGHWFKLAGNTLAKNKLLYQSSNQYIAKVASLFCASPKKNTLYSLLNELVEWRNDKIGHGALGLEIDKKFKEELAKYVNDLNEQLANYQDIWDAMQLQDANGQCLQGWQTIRQRHQQQVPGAHVEQNVALQLSLDGEILSLSPWLMLKRCTVCQKQDVFFFDSRYLRGNKKDRYDISFLDYLAGHKMIRPGHLEPQLSMQVDQKNSADIQEKSLGGDYAPASLDKLLQEKSLEAEYISPTYLRNSLKAFIENHEQGVYWLRAPAHIGKSIFVHGLLRMEKKPLLPGLKVVSFHIRREYRYEPAQFENYLSRQLEETLDLTALRQKLPQLDLEHPQPAQALSEWLGEFLAIYQQVHRCPEDKLLLCLDGLDELNQAESRTLLDFIPTSAQLPIGCYVLLSSRPQDGCPYWIWQHLEQRLDDITTEDINLDTPEYRAILRQFFDLTLKERFQAELHRACQNFWQQQKQLPSVAQVNTLVPTKDLRELVKSELWEQLRETQFCPPKKNNKLAKQFYQTVVLPIDESFAHILEHSEGRFLYVSFLCNLLKRE